MEQRFKDSNQSVAGILTLSYVFDVRSWIGPCLDDIMYHTTPHVFLFKRGRDEKTKMYYKHWSSDSWTPEKGLSLLKVNLSC
jgi:hypothetical protein